MNRVQFNKALAKHPGVTQDMEMEDAGIIQLDSPVGKRFADGCHTIVVPFNNNGGQSWKPLAYEIAISRLEMGLENCNNADCDICHNL